MDEILRAISEDGFVRISAINAGGIVERARQIHGTSPVATAALGRTLCGTSMLGELMKEESATITVRINGGGELGSLVAVSDSSGNVRGCVSNPLLDLPLNSKGKLDVGLAVGNLGMITISRDFGYGDPYIGSAELKSGEIAEDFAKYLSESEQTASAVGLGVLVDTDTTVLAAGGFIAQLMPGAPEGTIDILENNISKLSSVTDILVKDSIDELVAIVLSGLGARILYRAPVEYRCNCSRERILAAISCCGKEELLDIIEKNELTEVTCQFCDRKYSLEAHDIRKLL
ncbi:MAG: Hsp33 family molecular chaperone HslO [Ruminococcaceae bacterium]|nr:Hsp33 family molecular chaperone HslO [Oscillospiraceae bacterium]